MDKQARFEKKAPLASVRRSQILEAARRCFKQRGFHQTTLRDIAQEFGMSAGHIYNYFENKEAIVEGLVDEQTNRFMSMVSVDDCRHEGFDAGEMRKHLEKVVDAFVDPDVTPLAVAMMHEAVINPRVYDMVVKYAAKSCEHIVSTFYEANGEAFRDVVSPAMMEARVITVRAMLEGLKYALLFNPSADRELIKKVAVDRLMLLIEADREEYRRLLGKPD